MQRETGYPIYLLTLTSQKGCTFVWLHHLKYPFFFQTEEDKCVNKVVVTLLVSRAAAERSTKHEL